MPTSPGVLTPVPLDAPLALPVASTETLYLRFTRLPDFRAPNRSETEAEAEAGAALLDEPTDILSSSRSMLLFLRRTPAMTRAAEPPPSPVAVLDKFLFCDIGKLEASHSSSSTTLITADALDDDDEADPRLARALRDVTLATLDARLPRFDEAALLVTLASVALVDDEP